MSVVIGVRREDKSEWERRVPLVPADMADLQRTHDLRFIIQPSTIRYFSDDDYRAAGVEVNEDLSEASVVFGVKEMPVEIIHGRRAFIYFSHTVKGQDYNMPMLQHILDEGATLIDYEKIADEQNRRLIYFSLHAGYAGMIESLVCLGQRLLHMGRRTPLAAVKHAYEYDDLAAAKEHLRVIGERIKAEGLGQHTEPLVIGVAGYGNVSLGCQEILECLPVRRIEVADLEAAATGTIAEQGPLQMVVFREEDMVEPRFDGAQFVLQDYYQRPENYRGVFERYLPHLDLLMNTIYWEPRYPRLVTRKWVKANYGPEKNARLKAIGDISCDIDGSIEVTRKAPQPDTPCFVYEAATGDLLDGVKGDGPVVMAVDNLPCELPSEASEHFSSVLRDMAWPLAQTDWTSDFESLHLPPYLKKAVIAHAGQLAPDFRYLQAALDQAGRK